MGKKKNRFRFSNVGLPSAAEDAGYARKIEETPQSASPSYRLAFTDEDFMLREELRPVRLQLELLKPELAMQEREIEATIVMFGSARIPDPEHSLPLLEQARAALEENPKNKVLKRQLAKAEKRHGLSRYYTEARKLASIIASDCVDDCSERQFYVMTGGGPGVMEAANRGAADVGVDNVGLNIVLPHEQQPNPWITPDLCFRFHYFALRKMHLLMRAKALVVFPGGFGTLDELFDALTLVQTKKMKKLPILIFGKDFWKDVLNLDALAEQGMIDDEDLELVSYVDTAEQAWAAIQQYCDC